MTRVAAVVLAAGAGTRVGGEVNKVLLPLAGVPVVARSVNTARRAPGVRRVVLVVRPGEEDAVRLAVEPHLDTGPEAGPDVHVITGGLARHDSEWRAISLLSAGIDAGELDLVAIHDAARPLASPELWVTVLAEAERRGGAIPVAAIDDLVDRDGRPLPAPLVGVQTPQAFRAVDLLDAYRRAEADGFAATDTAGCLARYTDVEVAAVPSTAGNLKLTVAGDFATAEALLAPGPLAT